MSLAAFFLALAFVFTTINRLYSKYVLDRIDVYSVTLFSNTFCTILLLPIFIYLLPSILKFTLEEKILVLVSGILWAGASLVLNASVALNDFSFKEIVRQTRMLWVILGGILILNESYNLYDALGVFCIVLSVFIISYKQVPFRDHFSSKPMVLAWLSSFIVAALTLLEKKILSTISVLEYIFFPFLFISIFLLLLLNRSRVEHVRNVLSHNKKQLVLFSLLLLVGYITGLAAYQLVPISIAYPVIQSSTVFGVFIATFLFEERKDLARKMFAAAIAVIGVIIIQIF